MRKKASIDYGSEGSELSLYEWDVVGRDDSRDVADYDAWNAFNRLLSGA